MSHAAFAYSQDSCVARGRRSLLVRDTPPRTYPPGPRLLDQVRDAIRTRHYSPRTE